METPRTWDVESVVLGAIVLVALLVGAFVVHRVSRQLHEVKSEYVTASVIRAVRAYVHEHDGQWPTSWSDLTERDDVTRYAVVRFDISSDDILKDRNLIYDAIRPASGDFRTYPRARQDLDRLYETIAKAKAKQATPADAVLPIPPTPPR